MIDILAAVAGALNGGWALRLESKAAAVDVRVDAIEKVSDERHEALVRRLERMEDKIDSIPRDLREMLGGRRQE